MSELGLFICIFMFASDVILLGAYIFCAHTNRLYKANGILHYYFLHMLFSIAMISWGLILINQGFDIIWIDVDFSLIIIIYIPIYIYIIILDAYLRRKLIYPHRGLQKIARILLPLFILICLFVITILFYYAIHYYSFLITILG